MGLRISVLCTDGSPLGVTVKDIYGEGQRGIGIGGSEYALLTMCEAWHNAGHEVVLYNDPSSVGSPFEQRAVAYFDPNEKRDVLITFRSPNEKSIVAKGLKVWWSCDQYTINSFAKFAPYMDKIVCISPYHADYFSKTYGINNTIVIDLPVRVDDYPKDIEKIPYRFIFTSVPDRGLHLLREIWEVIIRDIPEASLVITSDYRLWGVDARNHQHRIKWVGAKNVNFMGAILRRRLVEEELKAELTVYPCLYDELFCISIAECQFASVYPITSDVGALATTNMGKIISGMPNSHSNRLYVQEVMKALEYRDVLLDNQEIVSYKAKERFHPDKIMEEWNDKVFK